MTYGELQHLVQNNRNIEAPVWRYDGYYVTTTFIRPTDNKEVSTAWDYATLAEKLPKGCRKELVDLLHIIVDNPSIGQKEIAERLGLSERTVGTLVAELKTCCIRRVGGYKSGHWEAK